MMNFVQMLKAIRSQPNPTHGLMQLAQQDPRVHQVMQMVNGKTPAEMEKIARQMAEQRGVDLNQLAQQIGVRLPK